MMEYEKMVLQIIVDKESEVFSDTKYILSLTPRPLITNTIPTTIDKALAEWG